MFYLDLDLSSPMLTGQVASEAMPMHAQWSFYLDLDRSFPMPMHNDHVLPGLGPEFPNANVGQYAGLLLLLFLWISDRVWGMYMNPQYVFTNRNSSFDSCWSKL